MAAAPCVFANVPSMSRRFSHRRAFAGGGGTVRADLFSLCCLHPPAHHEIDSHASSHRPGISAGGRVFGGRRAATHSAQPPSSTSVCAACQSSRSRHPPRLCPHSDHPHPASSHARQRVVPRRQAHKPPGTMDAPLSIPPPPPGHQLGFANCISTLAH